MCEWDEIATTGASDWPKNGATRNGDDGSRPLALERGVVPVLSV